MPKIKWNLFKVILAGALSAYTMAIGAEPSEPWAPAPDYPGWRGEGSSYFVVAPFQARAALNYYYKLHGEFPDKWAAIVEEGLFQTQLKGLHGEVIDPDDSNLGFYGDIFYNVAANQQSAVLVELTYNDGVVWDQQKLVPVETYAELFARCDVGKEASPYTALLRDTDRMRQFAILGILSRMIELHSDIRGDYPHSIDQLINAGLSPVDRSSINPVTGIAFQFDGSPGDLRYKYYSSTKNSTKPAYSLKHVMRDGSKPTFGFSY